MKTFKINYKGKTYKVANVKDEKTAIKAVIKKIKDELSQEEKEAIWKENEEKSWGFTGEEVVDFIQEHKLARENNNINTMERIEYQLEDCNYHTLVDLLNKGDYDGAYSWYRKEYSVNDRKATGTKRKARDGYGYYGSDKNIECYGLYRNAKKKAESLGLRESEYGDAYGCSYCMWNKTGDRNNDEEVACWYLFKNGKPAESYTQEEIEKLASACGISASDFDDYDEMIATKIKDKKGVKDDYFEQDIFNVGDIIKDKATGEIFNVKKIIGNTVYLKDYPNENAVWYTTTTKELVEDFVKVNDRKSTKDRKVKDSDLQKYIIFKWNSNNEPNLNDIEQNKVDEIDCYSMEDVKRANDLLNTYGKGYAMVNMQYLDYYKPMGKNILYRWDGYSYNLQDKKKVKDSDFVPFWFDEDGDDYWYSEARYTGEHLDVASKMDNKYENYRDFVDKEYSVPILGGYGNLQEMNELARYFEEQFPEKAKLAHRLFDRKSVR